MKSAAAFIAKAKKIGRNFGVEITIDSYIMDADKALVMATFLTDSRRKNILSISRWWQSSPKLRSAWGQNLTVSASGMPLLSIICSIRQDIRITRL